MRARSVIRSTSGAGAAEFTLVLPVLLMFMLGLIDAGRYLWEVNRLQKATQAGARFAAVTNMVPSSLAAYKFTTGSEVTQVVPGTPVPTTSFDSVTCISTGCTNSGTGPTPGFSSTAFQNIGDQMRLFAPEIGQSNFSITYKNVGLGYAGDPYGSDVAPQITVSILSGPNGLTFTPITFLLFRSLNLPSSTSTMTLEDGIGSQSN